MSVNLENIKPGQLVTLDSGFTATVADVFGPLPDGSYNMKFRQHGSWFNFTAEGALHGYETRGWDIASIREPESQIAPPTHNDRRVTRPPMPVAPGPREAGNSTFSNWKFIFGKSKIKP